MADLRDPRVLDSPEALVRLVQAGDEHAFARIVRLHRAEMVRVAFVVTGDVVMAKGAVAAAWPVAWNRLGTLDDPSRLGPWLCGLAAAEAVEGVRYWTRMAAEGVLPTTEKDGRPEDDGPAADPELAGRLAALDPADRALLALGDVAGLTTGELGQTLGMSAAAAAARRAELEARLVHDMDADPPVAPADPARPRTRLQSRLRAYADIRVPHVNVDAVARVARITRHDHWYHVASIVVSAVVAVVLTIVLHLGQPGAGPNLFRSGISGALPAVTPAASAPVTPGDD